MNQNTMDIRYESMQKMSVATESYESDVEQLRRPTMTIFPPMTSNFFSYLIFETTVGRIMGVVISGLLIYVVFSLPATLQFSNMEGYSEAEIARQIYHRPQNLKSLITETVARGKESGALSTLSISSPAYIRDGSIEVRLSRL
jgi:hypothetical protein